MCVASPMAAPEISRRRPARRSPRGLGISWTFVPATIPKQRRFFRERRLRTLSRICRQRRLVAVRAGHGADDGAEAERLRPGRRGDHQWQFGRLHQRQPRRSGAAAAGTGVSDDARWQRIIGALSSKHFKLWQSLATPANLARISRTAARNRSSGPAARSASLNPITAFTNMPSFRTGNANTSSPAKGSMNSSGMNGDCRCGTMPICDSGKACRSATNQTRRYTRVCFATANWGGVWRDIPVNRKTIRPRWIVPFRLVAKALHAPFGSERWHRFERQYFQYWMDATCNAACEPYGKTWRDRRGARHHIAWLAEQYLARHGVDLNDLPHG